MTLLIQRMLMSFLLDDRPRRKTILEVALAFLTLGDSILRPEFLHQRTVLFVKQKIAPPGFPDGALSCAENSDQALIFFTLKVSIAFSSRLCSSAAPASTRRLSSSSLFMADRALSSRDSVSSTSARH